MDIPPCQQQNQGSNEQMYQECMATANTCRYPSGDSRSNGLNEQLYYKCMAMTDTCERWKVSLANPVRCQVIHHQNQYGQHQELKKPEHDLMLFTVHHMSNCVCIPSPHTHSFTQPQLLQFQYITCQTVCLYTLTSHPFIRPALAATVSVHHMSNCMSVHPHPTPLHLPSPSRYSFSTSHVKLYVCIPSSQTPSFTQPQLLQFQCPVQNIMAQTFPESIALSHLASLEKKRSHLNKVVLDNFPDQKQMEDFLFFPALHPR